MQRSLVIRPVTIDDAAVLAKLSESIGREHVKAEPGRFQRASHQDAKAEFVRLLSVEGCEGLIAYSADSPIGYAIFKITDRVDSPFSFPGRYLYLQHISVEPAYRNQGVGTRLMESIKSFARSNRIEEIQLDVWLYNSAAVAFYEATGFVAKTQRMLFRF